MTRLADDAAAYGRKRSDTIPGRHADDPEVAGRTTPADHARRTVKEVDRFSGTLAR